MNTLTIADREPDAYDQAEKCPHCSRAMFQFGSDAPWRCAYPSCAGYPKPTPEEPR